jgi:hypothetical protein
VRTVRVERDHPKELRDVYDRLLVYVLVEKDGRWLNFNVECVRAGMSPYFSKYGYSRRFHEEFVEAQAEAQAAGRGIWDPAREHYRDYDVRLRWWNARAEVIARFEEEAQGRDNWIVLTHWDAMTRLEALEGKEVVVLAAVGNVWPREGKRPARVMLSRRRSSNLPLIFFDDEVLARSPAEEALGEFVRVHGTVTRYEFRARRSELRKGKEPRSQLQIVIRRPEQLAFVDTRPGRVGIASERPPLEPAPADEPAPANDDASPSLVPPPPSPAATEPTATEPTPIEPTPIEPTPIEPAPSDAAPTAPVVPEPIRTDPSVP